jgi:hypothetical protein
MELHQVESSMIQAFGYDAETETLLVIFNSGKAYEYFKVPQDISEGLVLDNSKGSYMRSLIIDQYPYRKVKKRSKR